MCKRPVMSQTNLDIAFYLPALSLLRPFVAAVRYSVNK